MCLQTAQIASVLQQVLSGLSVMHRASIIHRDVKMRNVFVVAENPLRVKLGDFGLACSIGKAGDHVLCCVRSDCTCRAHR
jgi:serine/threonine protein kinase